MTDFRLEVLKALRLEGPMTVHETARAVWDIEGRTGRKASAMGKALSEMLREDYVGAKLVNIFEPNGYRQREYNIKEKGKETLREAGILSE